MLFGDTHRDAQHALHVAVAVVVEGDVPILRLHLRARWDGEVEPHAGGHAGIEVLENDVVVVVVGVEVGVNANLEVGAHPRRVAHVGEHADWGGLVPVVRDVALEHQHAVGWGREPVLGVVAVHIKGKFVHLADAELDEIVHVHAFASTAAVGVEQEAVVPRVSAEENVGVAQRGDLCPVNLRIPRQIGPFTVANGGSALGQVPMQGLHGVVVLAGRAPQFDGHRVAVVGRAPGAEVELRGDKAVRVERVAAGVNLVDVGQLTVQGRSRATILGGGEESTNEPVVRVGRVVGTRLRVPPVLRSHVAVVGVGAGRRPTSRAACTAAVSGIASGNEACDF